MTIIKAMVSSKSNEWATPIDFFKELDREFNFTLDPCSTDENAKCKKHYTIKDDGITKDWSNERVFMNPPYGGHTKQWIKKAYEESLKGATVVCLITSTTDRSYWHDYIFKYAKQIRFIRGRLKFNDSKLSASFASAVVVFGPKVMAKKIVFYDESISKYLGNLNK